MSHFGTMLLMTRNKKLLTQVIEADKALDEITDFLAGLNNEQIEKALSDKFELVSHTIWDIKYYLEQEEKENGQ